MFSITSGNVIDLTTTTQNELADAITTANNGCSTSWVINLVAGTYSLAAVKDSSFFGNNGLPIIACDITINGAAGSGSTIQRSSGAPNFRIFGVTSGGKLTLNNVTVTGGKASATGGSGILSVSGEVIVRTSTVSFNTLSLSTTDQIIGAGIYSFNGILTLEDSTVTNNLNTSTTGDGGGIGIISGSLSLAGTTVQSNSAQRYGGGIAILSPNMTANVTLSDIRANSANTSNGGGVYNQSSSASITYSCIVGNSTISIYNFAAPATLIATHNWWGASTGPTHSSNPSGTGDSITNFVDYSNYLQTAPTDCTPPTIPPPTEAFCISREVISTPPGLNIRPNPSWEANPPNVMGGRLRITGTYTSGEGRWLRVNPYQNPGQPFDGIQGWVWEDVFRDPCDHTIPDNKDLPELPIMDESGNIVSTPPTIPSPTPTLPPPTPEYQAACSVHTNNPTNLRYAWYESSPIVKVLELYAPVSVHSWTDGGSVFNGSTVWYHVTFTSVTGESFIGWIHSAFLDANDLAQVECNDIQFVFRPSPTPPPTLTPTPSSTPPPDLSNIFPLPMIGPDPSHPPRLSDCLALEYTIPSVDIEPQGLSGGSYPLQTPARSTIMVVDRLDRGPTGVIVSIRVDMADVPQPIKDRLETMNVIPGDSRFENIDTSQGGSLHIGYSHIAEGTIPSDIEPVNITDGITEEEIRPIETWIGNSGDTGGVDHPHLDVAVFYVPDYPNRANSLVFESYGNGAEPGDYFYDFRHYWEAFSTMYDQAFDSPHNTFGKPIVVNPLVLWPSLQQDTTCSFEG
jgi:hypothetical protein